jgi:hypothetical protein
VTGWRYAGSINRKLFWYTINRRRNMRAVNDEFKIENKPVIFGTNRTEYSRYPFNRMKVGQSFYIEADDFNKISRIRQAAISYSKKHDVKFSVVKDGNGYRCGRIR